MTPPAPPATPAPPAPPTPMLAPALLQLLSGGPLGLAVGPGVLNMHEEHRLRLVPQAVSKAEAPAQLNPEFRNFIRRASTPEVRRLGNAACLRIDGPVMDDEGWCWESSFALTHASIAAALDALTADRAVREIWIEMDCPGWTSASCGLTLEALQRAMAAKPVRTRVTGLAASGGYWIAAATGQISIAPEGAAGNIGTLIMRYDTSEAMRLAGIKPIAIASDPDKACGYPGVPLTETFLAAEQRRVDAIQQAFVTAVAASRRVTPEAVAGLKGHLLTAADAKAFGLVDVIETQQQWEARISGAPAAPTTPIPTPVPVTPAARTVPAPGPKATTPKEPRMDLSSLTAADLRQHNPALLDSIQQEARQATLQASAAAEAAATPATFAQLKELYGDDAASIVASQAAGHTITQAREAMTATLQKTVTAQAATIKELQAKVVSTAQEGATPVSTAPPAGGGGGGEHEFMAKVRQHMEQTKTTLDRSMAAIASQNPELHRRYCTEVSMQQRGISTPAVRV